jgi:hypothetical protein
VVADGILGRLAAKTSFVHNGYGKQEKEGAAVVVGELQAMILLVIDHLAS